MNPQTTPSNFCNKRKYVQVYAIEFLLDMLLAVHLFNLFFEVMQVVEYSILLSAQYSKSDNFTKLHFIGISVKMFFLWIKIFKILKPFIKTSNGKMLI